MILLYNTLEKELPINVRISGGKMKFLSKHLPEFVINLLILVQTMWNLHHVTLYTLKLHIYLVFCFSVTNFLKAAAWYVFMF